MKKIICIAIICLFLFACQKKVISEGTVYSKYKIPLPNVTVVLSEYTTGKDAPLKHSSTQTDADGKFRFNFFTAKNRYFSLDVSSNSGWTHQQPLDREQLKHIDLYLH